MILDYIPAGKENGISREELKEKTGLSDRLLRKEKERAIKEGNWIDCIDNIYFIPITREEKTACYNRYLRQAKTMFKNVNGWRKDLDLPEGQINF